MATQGIHQVIGPQLQNCLKKGTDNSAADALSQLPMATNHCFEEFLALSVTQPIWVQQLTDSYSSHPPTAKLLTSLTLSSPQGHFTLDKGIIKYKARLWVASSVPLQQKILSALHSSAIGGHSGFLVTYMKVKKMFAWPGMKKMIKEFVSRCMVCQKAKTERVKYPGLLHNPCQFPLMHGRWFAFFQRLQLHFGCGG